MGWGYIFIISGSFLHFPFFSRAVNALAGFLTSNIWFHFARPFPAFLGKLLGWSMGALECTLLPFRDPVVPIECWVVSGPAFVTNNRPLLLFWAAHCHRWRRHCLLIRPDLFCLHGGERFNPVYTCGQQQRAHSGKLNSPVCPITSVLLPDGLWTHTAICVRELADDPRVTRDLQSQASLSIIWLLQKVDTYPEMAHPCPRKPSQRAGTRDFSRLV